MERKWLKKTTKCKRCEGFFSYETLDEGGVHILCRDCEKFMPRNYDAFLSEMFYTPKEDFLQKLKSMSFEEDEIKICDYCGEPYIYSAAMRRFDATCGVFDRPNVCGTCFSSRELIIMEKEMRIDMHKEDGLSDAEIKANIDHYFTEQEKRLMDSDFVLIVEKQMEEAFKKKEIRSFPHYHFDET